MTEVRVQHKVGVVGVKWVPSIKTIGCIGRDWECPGGRRCCSCGFLWVCRRVAARTVITCIISSGVIWVLSGDRMLLGGVQNGFDGVDLGLSRDHVEKGDKIRQFGAKRLVLVQRL